MKYSDKQFEFNEIKYNYRIDHFQCVGERTVEVPIFLKIIESFKNHKTLEIGNVLSNFEEIRHTVVDKYDQNRKCLNVDIIEYSPTEKFDLILSISTLEHIGFDMGEERQAGKIEKVFKWISENLTDTGRFVFSFPIGYNPEIDFYIKNWQYGKHFSIIEQYALKRVSKENEWVQSKLDWNSKYGLPFEYGNMIYIGVFSK